MLGKLLQGRYQVVQILSTGGFCQTYLAEDTHLPDRPTCVVKHLKPASNDPDSLETLRELFTREAQALEKLGNYDQVPQLLAHFEENQEFYLIQEFIVGHPLSAELKPTQRWNESQVIQLLQEVLVILEFVHSHGLIHRDIKPSNLIRRQPDGRLVLIDFGSVKQAWMQVVTAQGQTNASFAIGMPATIAVGTPGYMPTEQERGRPRLNSDIYALGMIGIQALTGLNPRQLLEDVDTGEIIWQHQAQVSARLASVLDKMVRYHFRDRYQSATEVLQALQPLANFYPPTQHSTNRASRAASSASPALGATPNKSVLLIGIATAIASVALMVVSYYSLQPPPPASQVQQYPVPIPSKKTAIGKITLANTLTGHSDTVWFVTISPDGQTVVSSSGDKTIKLWNLRTGELRRTLSGHSDQVLSVALSPDGQTLASSSWDQTIKIWNLRTEEFRLTLTEDSNEVWSLTISPDGQTLASSSGDTIKIWNLRTGKLRRTLFGYSDTVWSVAISPDGQILASGSDDYTIKLWNLRTGELLHTLSGHSSNVNSVAFDAAGKILVSGSEDKTIKIWRL
jgi:serine/threonine protein kinase